MPTILPELADTAWADATVRQTLDMVIGMRFHEDYLDPSSDVWKFLSSTGMTPARPDSPPTIADYLPTVEKEGSHAEAFAYREPNIFVLGWLVRRCAGQDITTLASELIWQHIGAEKFSGKVEREAPKPAELKRPAASRAAYPRGLRA